MSCKVAPCTESWGGDMVNGMCTTLAIRNTNVTNHPPTLRIDSCFSHRQFSAAGKTLPSVTKLPSMLLNLSATTSQPLCRTLVSGATGRRGRTAMRATTSQVLDWPIPGTCVCWCCHPCYAQQPGRYHASVSIPRVLMPSTQTKFLMLS